MIECGLLIENQNYKKKFDILKILKGIDRTTVGTNRWKVLKIRKRLYEVV